MAIELNHTVVLARDKQVAAPFLASLLGLPAPEPAGPFLAVTLANGVSLDYADAGGEVPSQHYAFLLSEAEFDAAFDRLQALNLTYYADPHHHQPGEINRRNGGRGLYFDDPDGHNMEIFTPGAPAG